MANQKPVDEIRIGRVKATIWRNGTDEQPRHNVTFGRRYDSTKKPISGRPRRASGVAICWCLRKWWISLTRASSHFRRKKRRRPRTIPSGSGFRTRRGWILAAIRSFNKENEQELPTL